MEKETPSKNPNLTIGILSYCNLATLENSVHSWIQGGLLEAHDNTPKSTDETRQVVSVHQPLAQFAQVRTPGPVSAVDGFIPSEAGSLPLD